MNSLKYLDNQLAEMLTALKEEYSQAEQIVRSYRTDRGHVSQTHEYLLIQQLRPLMGRLRTMDAQMRACHEERRKAGLSTSDELKSAIDAATRRLTSLLEQVNAAATDAQTECQTLSPHHADEAARNRMRRLYSQDTRT